MTDYLKLIVAAVGTAIVYVQSAFGDDVYTPGEKLQTAIVFTGAALVGIVANPALPWWRYTKAIVMFIAAGLAAWGAELANGAGEMSMSGWLNVAIAAGTAVGVFAAPRARDQQFALAA